MIAEIHHKLTTSLEDELTGNFFGTMRYLPFSRGLNQIFKSCAVSQDSSVKQILDSLPAIQSHRVLQCHPPGGRSRFLGIKTCGKEGI